MASLYTFPTPQLEPLDRAAEVFAVIRAEYETRRPSAAEDALNEAEARWRLIDRILFECLGWPRTARLELERDGERLDYLLRDEDGKNWVIVGRLASTMSLVERRGAGKNGASKFKLSGPAFQEGAWDLLRQQVNPYAALHGTALGVLTNGEDWVAAVMPPHSGRELKDEFGVIFAGLEQIEEHFERFYNYLSPGAVYARRLEAFLLGEQVWATIDAPKPLYVLEDSERAMLRPEREGQHEFSETLRRALRDSLRAEVTDEEMLRRCFVETRHSKDADTRLTRLMEFMGAEILSLRAPGSLEQRVEEQLAELRRRERGYMALLTGAPSAGKTTYVRRFFGHILRRELREQVGVLHLELQRLRGAGPAELAQALRGALEEALFGEAGPDEGQFCDLYEVEWGRYRRLYGDAAQRGEFIRERERRRMEEPDEDAARMLRYMVSRRQRLPVVIFDELDRLEQPQQEAALALAERLAATTPALSLVVAEDTTMWRLRAAQSPQLDPFLRRLDERFWLPQPKIGELIGRRFAYMTELFERHSAASERQRTPTTQGFIWNHDPMRVMTYLRDEVIWKEDERREWMIKLVNHDVRALLALLNKLMLSRAFYQDAVFRMVEGKNSLSAGQLFPILLRPLTQHFQEREEDGGFFNILDRHIDGQLSPLLPALLLQWLAHHKHGGEEASGQASFMELGEVVQFAEVSLRAPARHTQRLLDWMRSVKLIESYDPSATRAAGRLRITPRGELHLQLIGQRLVFMRELALTHPLAPDEAATRRAIREAYTKRKSAAGAEREEEAQLHGREIVASYVEYLLRRSHVERAMQDSAVAAALSPLIDALRRLQRIHDED